MQNSSFILFNIFFFLLIIIINCQFSSFNFELDSDELRCLNEYYKMQTVIIYEVTSESKDILSEVKSQSGHILIHYKNSTNIFVHNTI